MKILKIKEEKYKCPDCKLPLEFDGNEFIKRPLIIAFFIGWKVTGNAWFWCDKCKRNFLIKDSAKEEKF